MSTTVYSAALTDSARATAQSADALVRPLLYSNAILVLAIFVSLLVLAGIHLVRLNAEDRFTREAFRRVVKPLVATFLLWSIEYVGQIFAGHHRWWAYADYVLNSIVSLGFFVAGWSLLHLKERMHTGLRPARRAGRAISRMTLIAGDRKTARVFLLLLVGLLVASLFIGPPPPPHRQFDWASQLQAFSAWMGLLMLGLGLLRELTRENVEFVSAACAGSIVVYSFVQLFQVDEPGGGRYVWARLAAMGLKLTFWFGLGAYWVVVSQMKRAEREQVHDDEILYKAAEERHQEARARGRRHARQLQERQVLYYHLHDLIGVSVTRIGIALDAALKTPNTTIAALRAELVKLTALHAGASRHIRNLLEHQDEPSSLYCPDGIVQALEDQLEILRHANSSINVKSVYELKEPLPELVEWSLAKIAIEAINNVEKHAPSATKLVVALTSDGHTAILRLTDNGGGGGIKSGGTFGLRGMRSAARTLGTECHILSEPSGGTTVEVQVDLDLINIELENP